MSDLIHSHALWIVTIASVAGFVLGVLGVGALMVRLPADHFHGSAPRSSSRPMWVLRNVAGALLIAFGFLLLFLPGQGLLTILIGLSLLDIPLKRKLLQRIMRNKTVLESANRLRARFGQPPFEIPQES